MEEEKRQPIQVYISDRPIEIDIEGISITHGDCFLNSYQVSKQYPEVEIIEGIIVTVWKDNTAKAMHHAWNRKGSIHFDVTNEKIWTQDKAEMESIKEIKYVLIKEYNYTHFKNETSFHFSPETIENVREMNEILYKSVKK